MKSTKRFKMELSDGVLEAMNILMNNGYSAYAVGGCVRDSVLLKRPSDYDLTTSATPDEMLSVFSSSGFSLSSFTATVVFRPRTSQVPAPGSTEQP